MSYAGPNGPDFSRVPTDGVEARVLPAVERRVETGAVRFGDDGPGVFIRGDGTGRYIPALTRLLETGSVGRADMQVLAGLRDLLRSCIVK